MFEGIIYALGRGIGRGIYDAIQDSRSGVEETPTDADKDRAARFHSVVSEWMSRAEDDTGPDYSPQSLESGGSGGLGERRRQNAASYDHG